MGDTVEVKLLRESLETLKRIEALIRAQNEDAGVDDSMACPQCGSSDLKDASTMGDPRLACGQCGKNLKVEVVHG